MQLLTTQHKTCSLQCSGWELSLCCNCKALPASLMLRDKQVHQSACGPLGKTQTHVRGFIIQTLSQQLQEIYKSIHAADVLLCLRNVNSHTLCLHNRNTHLILISPLKSRVMW